MIAMCFQPESPRFLAKHGNWNQARKALSWIRKLPEDHAYLNWELDVIRNQLESEESEVGLSFTAKLKHILSTNIRTRLAIGVALM